MSIPLSSTPAVELEAAGILAGGPSPSRVLGNLALLEQAPLLFALDDGKLRRLARRLRPIHLEAGVSLFEQGSLGTTLYLVENGSCEIAVHPEPGHVVPIGRLQPGDLLGEWVLISEQSEVSVTTTAECDLLALDRSSLLTALPEGSPAYEELRSQIRSRQKTYRELGTRARWLSLRGEARVIAFYAPKGGSGRTTIALNLAAQLAKGDPGDVLLMDLDFPHNQAALLSGLVPTGSLARAHRGSQGEALEDTLLSGAELHNAGYMVLAGALRAEEAELVDSELVTQAIRTLRRSFGHLVVDLGASLSEVALSVFDMAERVVVVITPELPSLRGAQDVLRILHDVLHVPDERITLVLNHRQANAVVPREAVERTLGRRPDLEIAHDGNRSEKAALDGTVVAVSDPKSEMAKATSTLAGRLKRPDEVSQ